MPRPSAKGKLIEAGLETLHEKGFNACSIQDIAEAAKVPKGSFFNHFESKEAFAIEVLGPYGESSRIDMLFEEGVQPLDRLRRHFEFLADNYARYNYERGCLLANFAMEMASAYEGMRGTLAHIYGLWSGAVASVLREAQDTGTLDTKQSADELAAYLVNAWAGAVLRAKLLRNRTPIDEFFRISFELVLR